MRTRCLRICIAITSGLSRISQQTRLTSTLSIVPLPRNRFRGLVTNIIWLVSCSALDGLIGARLWSTYPGLLRRGAQTSTDDQEITEAGEPQFPHLSYLFLSLSIFQSAEHRGKWNSRETRYFLAMQLDTDVLMFLCLFFFSLSLSFSLSFPLCLPFAATVRSGWLKGWQILGAS